MKQFVFTIVVELLGGHESGQLQEQKASSKPQRELMHTLKSFRLPNDATTSFKPHLLLIFGEPTTLATFYLDLNYVLIKKNQRHQGFLSM